MLRKYAENAQRIHRENTKERHDNRETMYREHKEYRQDIEREYTVHKANVERL